MPTIKNTSLKKSSQTKKSQSTSKNQKIDLEALEGKELQLDIKEISRLSLDEIKEILLILKDLSKEKEYKAVYQIYKNKEEPPIAIEKLGVRIWSIFYDKWIGRFFIFFVGLIISFFIPLFDKMIKTGIYMPNLNKIASVLPASFIITPEYISFGGFIFLLSILISKILFTYVLLPLKENKTGATFMRSTMNTYVVHKNGKKPNFIILLLRNVLRHLPFSIINVLFMEKDKLNRGFHDKIFNTYVVRIKNNMNITEISRFLNKMNP